MDLSHCRYLPRERLDSREMRLKSVQTTRPGILSSQHCNAAQRMHACIGVIVAYLETSLGEM